MPSLRALAVAARLEHSGMEERQKQKAARTERRAWKGRVSELHRYLGPGQSAKYWWSAAERAPLRTETGRGREEREEGKEREGEQRKERTNERNQQYTSKRI